MPSTHSSIEQKTPIFAVGLAAVFYIGRQFFAEHYVLVEYIMNNQSWPAKIIRCTI